MKPFSAPFFSDSKKINEFRHAKQVFLVNPISSLVVKCFFKHWEEWKLVPQCVADRLLMLGISDNLFSLHLGILWSVVSISY